MKKLIVIFFLVIVNSCVAQYLDTLQAVFRHKSSIDVRLETRYSFIDNKIINVSGFRIGVAFQRKLRIGGGISWLNPSWLTTPVKKTFYSLNDNATKDTILKYLKFAYACFYIDFVFYKTQRWQLSVPIQLGTGLIWYQNKLDYDLMGKDKKYFFLTYEPGITVQFKVFKWFGLGSDVGYRFALKNNKKIGEHLNSPTYSFKILIWFNQLYFQAFPKSKITQKYGPAIW